MCLKKHEIMCKSEQNFMKHAGYICKFKISIILKWCLSHLFIRQDLKHYTCSTWVCCQVRFLLPKEFCLREKERKEGFYILLFLFTTNVQRLCSFQTPLAAMPSCSFVLQESMSLENVLRMWNALWCHVCQQRWRKEAVLLLFFLPFQWQ